MPIQDSTLNHRLSTPNKLFEALAAGVPIVASDLPELRRIVMEDPAGPLGVLCNPTHPVTIVARRGPDSAPSEESPGGYRIVRVGAPPQARAARQPRGPRRLRGEMERLSGIGRAIRRQSREAAAADPCADVYHGMAFQGIPIALALGRRSGGRVLYDARDLYPESGNLARMPAPVRALAGLVERRWARQSDVIVTVNDELAAILAGRFGRPLPAVVMNCPPAWTPPPLPDRRFL